MASRTASIVGVLLILLFLLVPSSSTRPPLKFKLHGKAQSHGFIYVVMKIGHPPRDYYLDVDTGSVLTWLQCDKPDCPGCTKWHQPHPYYQLRQETKVPRNDPLCHQLVQDPGVPSGRDCGYRLNYVQGKTDGLLIRDKFYLPINSNPHHRPIAFGCGYNQTDMESQAEADGILGLGRGSAVGLISQLKQNNIINEDVFSHCISTKGVGFLFLGGSEPSSSPTTWVPMNRNADNGHYTANVLANLFFGSKQGTLIGTQMKVVFDSGSTFTYFDSRTYQATEAMVKASLHHSLTPVHDGTLSLKLCWRGRTPFKSIDDVKPLFKTIYLVFDYNNPKATMNIAPENYLIISTMQNVCFGILDSPVSRTNIIGGITMQDRIVTYNNEKFFIGWSDDLCRNTKSYSEITSRL
ncbi:hypothetical protein ACP70R_022504 [Stipagrostis hirtigluma subsp. patula]